MKKFIIWGTGQYCNEVLSSELINPAKIVAFVDINPAKQGGQIQGIDIVSPENLADLQFDEILVAIFNRKALQEVTVQMKGYQVRHIDDYLEEQATKALELVGKGNIVDCFKEHDKLLKKIEEIGTINGNALKNARVISNRRDILKYMPTGKICAEVGVAYGDFTKSILNIMHPSLFYAIDYFGNYDFAGRTDIQDSGLSHQQWYEHRFEKEIEQGIMKVEQGYSWEVLEKFPDRYFDYIYIDACHRYDAVFKDAEISRRKIKLGGIIAFNDYTLYNFWMQPTNVDSYYGVVPVANKLINETKSEVLFIGLEKALANDLVIRYLE